MGDKGWFWITVSLALLCRKSTRRVGFAALLSLAGSFLVTNLLLKNILVRPRPFQEFESVILLIAEPVDYSFPSGHTSASFAAALIYYKMLPKPYGLLAVILAVMIAFSRLYLGAHYPTDVFGGFLAAAMISVVVCRSMERYKILE